MNEEEKKDLYRKVLNSLDDKVNEMLAEYQTKLGIVADDELYDRAYFLTKAEERLSEVVTDILVSQKAA